MAGATTPKDTSGAVSAREMVGAMVRGFWPGRGCAIGWGMDGRRQARALGLGAMIASLSWGMEARAEGQAVPIDVVAPGFVKLNGVLSEWTGAMTALNRKVSGSPGNGKDLEVRASLAADDDALYLAADITDDKQVRSASYAATEDRLSLVLAFPSEGASSSYTAFEVDVFHGDPGHTAGAVQIRGAKVAGAQVVEAPRKGGFTVEARIPWAAFPPAARVRCGLRGAIRYHDSDGAPKGVVGTSDEAQAARMPRLLLDAERGIEEVFAKEKGLQGAPRHDLIVDLVGDAQRERVLLWGQFIIVAGAHFREGKQFYFKDLAVDPGQISQFEARELTGTGKAQLLLRKRKGTSAVWRETFEVLEMQGEALAPLFQHDVGASTEAGSLGSTVKIDPKQIEVSLANNTGLTASNFNLAPEAGVEPLLLPWGTLKSRTYRHDGTRFSKIKEETKPAGDDGGTKGPARPPAPPPPPPAHPPTPDELQEKVLDLYRKDRKLDSKSKPRFDLATDVAEDRQNERILVFGRELVVFGKGFQGGQGYTALSVGFADPRDVADVTTRDLNGDGKAEILVRGVQRIDAPKDLGKGKIERELLLVYTVQGDKLIRVAALETGMRFEDKRVASTVAFLPAAQGLDLQMGPGNAVGWDQKSFPFRQETAPISGIEPLVLPWSSPVRLRWGASGYAR